MSPAEAIPTARNNDRRTSVVFISVLRMDLQERRMSAAAQKLFSWLRGDVLPTWAWNRLRGDLYRLVAQTARSEYCHEAASLRPTAVAEREVVARPPAAEARSAPQMLTTTCDDHAAASMHRRLRRR